MLLMKRSLIETAKEIELANQEIIRMFGEKGNYKYLEILEADTIKQAERIKIRKVNLRRTRTILEIEISSKRKIPEQFYL